MASRADILEVLGDLEAILIRASFTDDMEATYIKEVSLDEAVRQNTPFGIVMDVEECRCPPGYEGLSCEQCSPGHYLDSNDRSRGYFYATRMELLSKKLKYTCEKFTPSLIFRTTWNMQSVPVWGQFRGLSL